MNFMGHNIWVADGREGFEGVAVAERDEPPAIIGSHLHKLAYPEEYEKHEKRKLELPHAHHHPGENVLDVQQRGEYLYAALGKGGFRIYDIANIDNRDPKSRNIIGVGTLLDGNPSNNFLERAVTFNPDGVLTGGRRITIAGTYAYILTGKALVVVSLEDPFHPKVTAQIGAPDLVEPRGVQIQFRYGFVVDRDGLKVLDVTALDKPRLVSGARVPFKDARTLYLARTYASAAAGPDGIGIVDIERPEQPTLAQTFNAGGAINDTNDVKIGMTNASQFAYIADGHNGLQVVQLFSPSDNPNYLGFSPHPTPTLIAH